MWAGQLPRIGNEGQKLFIPHAKAISPVLSGVNSISTGSFSGNARLIFMDGETISLAHVSSVVWMAVRRDQVRGARQRSHTAPWHRLREPRALERSAFSRCLMVDSVIDTLTTRGAITSVTNTNTRFLVAAGGFEGTTNPSYVFSIQDTGPGAASMRDVNVLENALGYVLKQGGVSALQRRQRQSLRLRP
jgi:hypothetical protein